MVAYHVLDAQAFDGNGPVGVHDLAGGFVRKVPTLVPNASVGFGHQELGPPPVLATALLGLELALSLRQDLVSFSDVARIVDVASIGEGGEVLQASVYVRAGNGAI